MVSKGCRERKPVTYFEILDALQYRCATVCSSDTLRHHIRTIETVKTVVGVPMEAQRVAVNPDDIAEWFTILEEKVRGIPADWIFNLDETGCAEFQDTHEMRVVVPVEYEGDTIPVPVDRHSKRSTLVGCISAGGYRMKPCILLERATVESELHLYGYGPENVMMAQQDHAFMTTLLFQLWADEVFFPSIAARRLELDYTGRVLVLMDGLGSHHTEAFTSRCHDEGIEILFLVPHSSDQCQPLDLLTFAILKRSFASSRFHRLRNPQSNKIVRMLGAWFASSVPHLNVEAFMRLGLIPFADRGQIFVNVDPTAASRVRGGGNVQDDALAPLGREGQRRVRIPNGADARPRT
jgi:hypothetical protein